MQVTDPVCGMTIESERPPHAKSGKVRPIISAPNRARRNSAQPLTAKKAGDHAAHGSHSCVSARGPDADRRRKCLI